MNITAIKYQLPTTLSVAAMSAIADTLERVMSEAGVTSKISRHYPDIPSYLIITITTPFTTDQVFALGVLAGILEMKEITTVAIDKRSDTDEINL